MPSLKDLRDRALLSQGELARAVGVNRQTIHSWESGRWQPKPEYRRKLVEVLKCTPDELLAALKETREARTKPERGDDTNRRAA